MQFFQTAPVKFLVPGLILLTLLFGPGCGQKDDSLRVKIDIPPEETEELFWYGVKDRRITWVSGDQRKEESWSPGKQLPWEVEEGDEIQFSGLSESGAPLVVGSGQVDRSKMVSIPLRRVL